MSEREPDESVGSLARVRTGISAAYWFDPASSSYEPALLKTMTRANTQQTAWFDELFESGIKIPSGGTDTPLTLLLTGEPGTGKSTLALEMCYRLGKTNPRVQPNQTNLSSIYLTTEGHVKWTIEHARNFNWDTTKKVFGEEKRHQVQIQALKSAGDLKKFVAQFGGSPSLLSTANNFFNYHVAPEMAEPPPDPNPRDRDLIVLDNLNAVAPDPASWFPLVRELSERGFRLFILVLDTAENVHDGHSGNATKQWGYLADVVIHLGRQYPAGYMIRTIEILKARYQRHVYGAHQMKIVNRVKRDSKGSEASPRDHPYRTEGGIFVFPSMHLALSRRKKIESTAERPKRLVTPFEPLDNLLGGGFLPGRCVALAGARGTHKSRLAFAQILKTLHSDENSRALVISLQEDERSVENDLCDIDLESKGLSHGEPRSTRDFVKGAVKSGRLELNYYPPGFIAPEEFFHRVQLSIARHKKAAPSGDLLLVFNSLDLLHSHFPLCAQHGIFVPALVELLCLENVTSFFISTTTGAEDPYGLMSMADPVLRFSRDSYDRKFFTDRVFDRKYRNSIGKFDSIVTMTVERFAAGISAGTGVFLALIDDDHPLASAYGSGLKCFRDKAQDTRSRTRQRRRSA